jgi:hypothetical protein
VRELREQEVVSEPVDLRRGDAAAAEVRRNLVALVGVVTTSAGKGGEVRLLLLSTTRRGMRVRAWRGAVGMDVPAKATEYGDQLDEQLPNGRRLWAWHRSDNDRHACFRTEREALTYMEDWLRRVAVFER